MHTFRGVRSANVSGVRGHAFCVIYKDIETLRFSLFGRSRSVFFAYILVLRFLANLCHLFSDIWTCFGVSFGGPVRGQFFACF